MSVITELRKLTSTKAAMTQSDADLRIVASHMTHEVSMAKRHQYQNAQLTRHKRTSYCRPTCRRYAGASKAARGGYGGGGSLVVESGALESSEMLSSSVGGAGFEPLLVAAAVSGSMLAVATPGHPGFCPPVTGWCARM